MNINAFSAAFHHTLPKLKIHTSPLSSLLKMDESWRMRMGMPKTPPPPPKFPNCHPRRSTDDATSYRRKHIISDFADVFGGPPPPLTVHSRPSISSSTYEEIFLMQDKTLPVIRRNGRCLPEFTIPVHTRGDRSRNENVSDKHSNCFYNDTFGLKDAEKPALRSNSSSTEVRDHPQPSDLGNGDYYNSLFASKICRSVNVNDDYYQREQNANNDTENDYLESSRNYPLGLNLRNASAETISFGPISNGSYGVSADSSEYIYSPSSSVCHSAYYQRAHNIEVEILRQDDPVKEDEDDDESLSSFIIEFDSDHNREGTCESNGVDEAIAWVNEKFKWSAQDCQKDKPTEEVLSAHQLSDGQTESSGSMDEQHNKWAAEEETEQYEIKIQTEIEVLDEKIRLWSNGKETDIRLLLSSLHHILWPNSGWILIPPIRITERSELKKAYQKARLCLHPDKLQQRGAMLPHKYIAEKAFLVLQDAWTSFNSEEDLCR